MKNQDDRNLAVIEETSLRYFKNPESAEILALKAKLQSKIKVPQQDPNRTFSQVLPSFNDLADIFNLKHYFLTFLLL
jgi:hypothetical protein